MNSIDSLLNSITMYRLLIYSLGTLSLISVIFGFVGLLPYTGFQFLILLFVIFVASFLFHTVFKKIFNSATNTESVWITAFILFFLVSPIFSTGDLLITITICFISVASKYLLAINKKHLFNPVAISIFLVGLLGFGNGIWWVGSSVLLPFVTLFGLAIVRKVRRFTMFFAFLASAIVATSLFKTSPIEVLTSWPIIFLGTVMLTEPATAPTTKTMSIIYAVIVGLLFGSRFSFGSFHSTPEMAIIIGNIFAYVVSPKLKLFSKLKNNVKIGHSIYEFEFMKDNRFSFKPGQYMEWTLQHQDEDSRGNRRYLTIASSPTEESLKIAIKVNEERSSTFKKKLLSMNDNDIIIASQLSGDFTLPDRKNEKLVFIAGGIGVTPFRSILKYLLDINEKRDIIFFYTCTDPSEFVYEDVFSKASKELGIKVIYVLTHPEETKIKWNGEVGHVSEGMIKKYVDDYKNRKFYISGPNAMVENYKKMLKVAGVSSNKIVVDYFSGY